MESVPIIDRSQGLLDLHSSGTEIRAMLLLCRNFLRNKCVRHYGWLEPIIHHKWRQLGSGIDGTSVSKLAQGKRSDQLVQVVLLA